MAPAHGLGQFEQPHIHDRYKIEYIDAMFLDEK
jgi:hypothetical protein